MTVFGFTGAPQAYVVPAGVTAVLITCLGAGGLGGTFGGAPGSASAGAAGGLATGILAVTPGETLHVYVGGTANSAFGGYNGGGNGGTTSTAGYYAGGGGGGSDVRQGGTALADRKIVAGGGAGNYGTLGGAGGGLVGGDGGPAGGVNGQGGTQSAGGSGGTGSGNGSLGQGGNGAYQAGGSGGGGYYGGGGGGNGGGGSSYIGGVTSASTTLGAGSPSATHGQITIVPANMAPNAPTLTSPIGNTSENRSATVRLAWVPSDPDAGDTQAAYDVRWRPVGDPTWSTAYAALPNAFHDLAPGALPGTTAIPYEWQARTYDQAGLVGPWSGSAFFTAATAPAGPVITSPVNTATIPASFATLVWSTPTQDAYQVQSLADAGGVPDTTVLYATGTVELAATRTVLVPLPVNGRTEHLQVRVRDDGLWSPWTSVRVTASYAVPAAPTPSMVAVSTDPDAPPGETDALLIGITNPTPTGDQPSITGNQVFVREAGDDSTIIRVASGVPANGSVVWRGPAHRQEYETYVLTSAVSGATSASTWTDGVSGSGPFNLTDFEPADFD